MANNTGKKRKRKNVRLHRTVRRTIAAIFMIMAVVVAAIPVEQLGTMQAKTTTDVRTTSIDAIFKAVYNADGTNNAIDKKITAKVSDANSYGRDTSSDTYAVKMSYTDSTATYNKELESQNEPAEAVMLFWNMPAQTKWQAST